MRQLSTIELMTKTLKTIVHHTTFNIAFSKHHTELSVINGHQVTNAKQFKRLDLCNKNIDRNTNNAFQKKKYIHKQC